MTPQTLSECASQRLLVQVSCRSCPNTRSWDPRGLLGQFQHRKWPDTFEEVKQRLKCSHCGGKRLAVSAVRPPLQELTVDGDRFVFAIGNRVAGPERATWHDAFQDAIDAGMGEYQHGRPFLTVPGRIVNLRVG